MNFIKQKIVKLIIDKAKRNKFIQNIFEQPIDLDNFQKEGSFIDKNGNSFHLYKGLRSKIKPGWEKIFDQTFKSYNKSPKIIDEISRNGRLSVEKIIPLVNIYLPDLKNKSILEIGCHAGGATLAFTELEVKEVYGSDFSGYKIDSTDPINHTTNELIKVNQNLEDLRNLVKFKFSNPENVKFIDDDICNTNLNANQFDLICSWDVLEHLNDPLNAFKNINNLLNVGGIAIHDYNPFFSIIGGHSACTIDFPWGHVILDEKDFDRFNKEIQPNRKQISMSFYKYGIN